MNGLITAVAAFAFLFVCQAFGSEHSLLARVTVYWRGEGSGEHASSNGARLHERHCAVDPKKIPYGSKVVFPDVTCVAVDSGSAVVNRKAARSSGRNAAQRNAIVIDRFFHTKREALAWANAHPHFMTVRTLTPGSSQAPTNIASSTATSKGGRPQDFYQHLKSSLGAAALTIARFISTIRQALNISAFALLFAINCALLATVVFFYSSIIRQISAKFFFSFSR